MRPTRRKQGPTRSIGDSAIGALRYMQLGADVDADLVVQRERYLRECAAFYDELLGLCESPIERRLLAEMLDEGWEPSTGDDVTTLPGLGLVREVRERQIFRLDETVAVVQPTFDVYGASARVDFLFFCSDKFVAVELDGHDFHERTKEQARRDKSRDRMLLSVGIPVMRFTGGEVYGDPYRCLGDIVHVIAPAQDLGF